MSRMSPDDWERARALVAAGLSPEQVAGIMGTSVAAIRRRCVLQERGTEIGAPASLAAPVPGEGGRADQREDCPPAAPPLPSGGGASEDETRAAPQAAPVPGPEAAPPLPQTPPPAAHSVTGADGTIAAPPRRTGRTRRPVLPAPHARAARRSPGAVITLFDAWPGECRWPLWDDEGKAARWPVCGAPVLPGRSWCADHAARAFIARVALAAIAAGAAA